MKVLVAPIQQHASCWYLLTSPSLFPGKRHFIILLLGTGAQVRDLDNRQFLMFYEAVAADGTRSIGLAASKDGISWK
eukprot:scaffold167868_cov17-Tisochrysis_lutea.AAC.1